MLYNLEKKPLSSVMEPISIPSRIKALLKYIPNVKINLIDYDYIGEATPEDFESFASQLYYSFEHPINIVLVTFTDVKHCTKLLLKKHKSNLFEFPFQNQVRTVCTPVSNSRYTDLIFFINTLKFSNIDDLKIIVEMLFSGLYENQYFMILSQYEIPDLKLDDWLEKSFCLEYDRHNYPARMNISLETLYKYKGDSRILYPYGGTDFGSFMIFEF